MEKIPIDPTKPVSGNFRGTFAGAVAVIATGFLAKNGFFSLCAEYFCGDGAGQLIGCHDAEWTLAILAMALIGGAVNYAVTHFAQVAKLKELYDMLPEVKAEYDKTGMPKSQDPRRRS